MPPKKRGGSEADGDTKDDGTGPDMPKRQRVSLACDSCRVARERCDGVRPHCGTCVAQNRNCSYTPNAKKRGVQTGYLRTIELALSWFLHEQSPQSEEALHQLLSNNASVLRKKGKAADRLHKKWTKSSVNKQIASILSGEPLNTGLPTDTSSDDSETSPEGDGTTNSAPTNKGNTSTPQNQRNITIQPKPSTLRLPPDWRRLLDVYFAYTHCWLPIVNQAAIHDAVNSFPQDGLPLPPDECESSTRYAELWAVLAVASYQEASSPNSSIDRTPPDETFAIARSLMPANEGSYRVTHLHALLLHSVIHIGKGSHLAAWMTVGSSIRLALYLRGAGVLSMHEDPAHGSFSNSGALSLATCFFLDTLTSACLGQTPSPHPGSDEIMNIVTSIGETAPEEPWTPVVGFGPSFQDPAAQTVLVQPSRALCQLFKFSQTLSANLQFVDRANQSNSSPAEELARSLDPKYSFCNSVIFGGSTPPVPSAFLLQTAFLATTTRLVKVYRASLVSSLLEVVESCLAAFGPGGTPPVVIGLLHIVESCGHARKMHETERQRWLSVMESLKEVWGQGDANPSLPAQPVYNTPHEPRESQPARSFGSADGISPAFEADHFQRGGVLPSRPGFANNLGTHENHIELQTGSEYNQPHSQHHHGGNGFPMGPPDKPSAAPRAIHLANSNMPFQQSGMRLAPSQNMFDVNAGLSQHHVDYDAILEEIGSIDCADGLDMDPQFMTNLGFAPGVDIGEMFQGDFGV